MTDWTLRPATPDDIPVARSMLAAAGLPTADLSSECLAIVAELAGDIAGMIGIERFADVGLLRSLVVGNKYRGVGLGNELVHALEAHALRSGLSELWLLTIDADRWFAGLGYESRQRADAPQDICQTQEFSSLCPGDAVLMMKALGS